MTDHAAAIARAKNPKVHPWRVWQPTAETLRKEKERTDRIVPHHTRLVR